RHVHGEPLEAWLRDGGPSGRLRDRGGVEIDDEGATRPPSRAVDGDETVEVLRGRKRCYEPGGLVERLNEFLLDLLLGETRRFFSAASDVSALHEQDIRCRRNGHETIEEPCLSPVRTDVARVEEASLFGFDVE